MPRVGGSFSARSPALKYGVKVNIEGYCQEVKRALAQVAGISDETLVLTEIYKSKVYRLLVRRNRGRVLTACVQLDSTTTSRRARFVAAMSFSHTSSLQRVNDLRRQLGFLLL